MPSAKSGSAGSPVSSADPVQAEEADKADPGEMAKVKAEQQQLQKGKYGSTSIKPYRPPQTREEKREKKSWIEIEMVGEDDNPIPGERYKITLADGETVAEGSLDEKGFARVDGIDPGSCKVTFPNLDREAWIKI